MGALVIIAVLIAGSTYISLQESRLGQNQLVQSRAIAVAEYGLNKIQADWDKTPNLQMNVGDSYNLTYTVEGQGTCEARMTRLNNETFWIVSEGRASSGNATSLNRTAVKRVSAFIRLRIPTIEAKGAITAGGNVTVKGNAAVNGRDSVPGNWGCDGTQPTNMPGIVVPPGSTVNNQGSGSISGTPPSTTDVEAGQSSTYFGFGEENWNSLILQANVKITNGSPSATPEPTAVNGGCNKTSTSNWGEPKRPTTVINGVTIPSTLDGGETLVPECYNYFPIIYASNGLSLSGNGRGQGIMLVQGDFTINGSFDWYGVIVVTGSIIRGNGSAKVMGAVMAADETVADGSQIMGTTSYNYSSCSVQRALRGSASVVQAKHRAWVELY
jgi:hypothetical protein